MDELQKFLDKKRFKDLNPTEMNAHIRDTLGGGDTRMKISGKTTYLWYVPWQKQEEKSLDIPNMEEETPF